MGAQLISYGPFRLLNGNSRLDCGAGQRSAQFTHKSKEGARGWQSIAAQETNMLHWASVNGFQADPAAVFLEDDTSGAIPFAERPKGAALLRLLRERRHKHLIVPKIDRLGRSAMDVQNTIHTLRENLSVRVHIIDLGGHHFDTGHPLSGMIIAVLAYAAQMELDRIRERIQTVLDHKASKGELIAAYVRAALSHRSETAVGLPESGWHRVRTRSARFLRAPEAEVRNRRVT